jgi:hypothetical protein
MDCETQFNMDLVFNRFTEALSNLPDQLKHDTNAIIKLKEQTSAELGEEIECAVRAINRRKADRHSSAFSLSVYNIIRNSSGNLDLDKKGLTEEVAYPSNYQQVAGLDKFMYLPNQFPHWTVVKVCPGDILLVPFGNVPVNSVPYRGFLCFAKPWQALPETFPQLELKPIMRISKSFKRLNGGETEIGWMAFVVRSAPELSLPLGDYGWFKNAQEIYFGSKYAGHELAFTCEDILVKSLAPSPPSIELDIRRSEQNPTAGLITIRLPLKSHRLGVSGEKGFGKAVLFRVKNVTIK